MGNHAVHQLNNYDTNYVPQSQWINAAFQPFGLDNLRRFPGWTALTWWVNNGDATYNSLQVLFKTQIQKFQLQAAYTWSHSIGNVSNQNSSGGSDFESYTWGPSPGLDRGNTLVNRPQIFVANAIYYLPSLKDSNSFVQATVGGWELAVISQYSSGASTTLYQYWFTDLANGNTVGLIGTGNPQARPLATAIPWITRLSELPLIHQPGAKMSYGCATGPARFFDGPDRSRAVGGRAQAAHFRSTGYERHQLPGVA